VGWCTWRSITSVRTYKCYRQVYLHGIPIHQSFEVKCTLLECPTSIIYYEDGQVACNLK
jgi:hypothetical protein